MLYLLPAQSEAGEFHAKVISVLDGDTVLAIRYCVAIPCPGQTYLRIRLADIDAPESNQPYGREARTALAGMVMNRRVLISGHEIDKYGRLVAKLTLNDLDVNAQLLRNGWAWEYSYHHSNPDYAALELEARKAGRGLWAQAEPVPPWQWRRDHPHHSPTSAPSAADATPIH